MVHHSGGGVVAGSIGDYKPFGGYRTAPTADDTDRGYTGHLHTDGIGLIYMNARFYVGSVGRFASADPLIPDPGSSQGYNRYSYSYNNPLMLIDPSGHNPICNNDGSICSVDPVDPVLQPPSGHRLEYIGDFNLSSYVFADEDEFWGTLRNIPGLNNMQAKTDFLFDRGGVVMQGTGQLSDGVFIHITNPNQLYWIDRQGNRIVHEGGEWKIASTGDPGVIDRIGNPEDAIFARGKGRDLTPYYSIAAPGEFAMGSLFYIPAAAELANNDGVFEVQDRGGAIEGTTLDVFVGQGFANSDHWFANRPDQAAVYKMIPLIVYNNTPSGLNRNIFMD